MPDKREWLKIWGYSEGTPEAEAAWQEKLAFKPRQLRYSISRSVNYEYACPITGKPILSKREHIDNLRRHGCHVLESGEKEANERRRAETDAALETAIDQTVEKAIDQMPSDKRELLARELVSGASAEVVRQ